MERVLGIGGFFPGRGIQMMLADGIKSTSELTPPSYLR
jgi:hypothetical protein